MEVAHTPIGVIFEIPITTRERKALWEILAHFIGVHFKLIVIVDIKIVASGLTRFYYALTYRAYYTAISLLSSHTWMISTDFLHICRDIELLLAIGAKRVAWYLSLIVARALFGIGISICHYQLALGFFASLVVFLHRYFRTARSVLLDASLIARPSVVASSTSSAIGMMVS
jgi:hypothetical protein